MIITFSSPSHNSGNSAALVNIAELIARSNMRVLMVDFDLENPTIEKYYSSFPDISSLPGLVDLFLDYKRGLNEPDIEIKDVLVSINNYMVGLSNDLRSPNPDTLPSKSLFLITPGKRNENNGHSLLFDWQDFYANWGGELFFEWLKREFYNIADVILINIPFGDKLEGQICNYQLSDLLILFCLQNKQSLDDASNMVQRYSDIELSEIRENALNIIVVPSQVEYSDSGLLDEFKENFLTRFPVPKNLVPVFDEKFDFWALGLPYIPYYAMNYEVPVRFPDRASTEYIIYAYRNLAKTISLLSRQKFFI